MARRVKYLFMLVGAWALIFASVSCGRRAAKDVQAHSQEKSEYVFRIPQVPPALQGEAAGLYVRKHLWDGFDFQDTLQLDGLDKRMMTQAFAVYLTTVPQHDTERHMTELMQRAATSKPMLEYFLDLAENLLNDPNSPLRDDEKYIPVLEFVLSSPLLDEYEKMPYASDLQMARQNRVGCVANDFVYTTADGRKRSMLKLKADYTLIFISNPGCPMCREVKEQIMASGLLSDMIREGAMKVLVIYPDEDIEAWRESLKEYPTSWVNGYDEGMKITHERLYDLRAIPALYLLDGQKRVLVKDCADVGYIENFILKSVAL